MTAHDCGRVAAVAGVQRLILSHFYPVAERYDVRTQARQAFDGRITMAKDRMRIELPPN
jgi:ribonuclease BN (tRNA processing enzyme)